MANVFLCGHGEWKTSGVGAIFTTVPRGTSLSVYTPIGRFLGLSQACEILRGDQGRLTPDQKFHGYQSCTNLTLCPATEYGGQFRQAGISGSNQVHMVLANTKLSELLQQFEGHDLHWMACRVRFGGRDTTEGGFNDDYFPARGIGV